MEFGELNYTLTGLAVAKRNADGTFDTPIYIENGQMYSSEPEHETDKLSGYGQYTEGLSVPKGTKLSLKMGGIEYDVLAAMGVVTISASSGATPHRTKTIDWGAGGEGVGYFGVIGTSAAKGGGIVAIGHQKVMLEEGISVTADGESNKFNISEASAYSFPVNNRLFRGKTYETAADFTMPTNGTDFANFFS